MGRKPVARWPVLQVLLTQPKTWKELHIETGLKKATLSSCLERMRHEGEVRPLLSGKRIQWDLTSKGRYAALTEQVKQTGYTDETRKQLSRWSESRGFVVEIRELQEDSWWNLVKETIKVFNLNRLRPMDLTEKQFMDNLRSYVNQVKPVVTAMWPSLLHMLTLELATMLIIVMVFRAFLPTPLTEKDRERLAKLIDLLVGPYVEAWGKLAGETLRANFNYLEALVVASKATEEGKMTVGEWQNKPFGDVIRLLEERKLLKVIRTEM